MTRWYFFLLAIKFSCSFQSWQIIYSVIICIAFMFHQSPTYTLLREGSFRSKLYPVVVNVRKLRIPFASGNRDNVHFCERQFPFAFIDSFFNPPFLEIAFRSSYREGRKLEWRWVEEEGRGWLLFSTSSFSSSSQHLLDPFIIKGAVTEFYIVAMLE